MKWETVFRWFWLNLAFFMLFFLLTWALVILFPDIMLRAFGKWDILLRAVGAKGLEGFDSQIDMFTHILKMNGVAVVIYLVIGLLLQSPLVMLFTGVFYACIAFLAPFTIGRPFALNDWLLVSAELFMLTLSISLTSALGGDLFGARPDVRSLANYWKHHWNKLLPRPVSNWRLVLREWQGTVLVTVVIITALLLFVAWFETYGC